MQDIRTVDAELKIVIAGNHDLDLDEEWVRKNAEDGEEEEDVEDSRKCVELMKSYKEYGVHYLEEGKHEFELKDGRRFVVWASPYTREFNGYAFAYGQDENRFRNIPKDIDILMTHGPPSFTEKRGYSLDVNVKGEKCGCQMLGDAVNRVKPRLHCFGHVHEGRGAVDMQWTETAEQRINVLPDEGAVLRVNKKGKGSRSVLVNAAVWGERKGWTIDLEI